RLLEAEYLASLRVDAAHDVLDGAILAGRVHRLKHDQHGKAVVRVESRLRLRQLRQAPFKDFLGAFLERVLAQVLKLLALLPAWVVVDQLDLLILGDAKQVDNVFADHGSPRGCRGGYESEPPTPW